MSGVDEVAQRSARGSLYLFAGNFISELANAVGAVLVARLLTPQEYGVFGLSLVLPGVFLMFSNWGVAEALTRFMARYQTEGRWGDIRRMARTGLLFNGGLAILLAAAMYASADPLAAHALARPELGDLVRLASALVVVHTVFNAASAIFFGLDRMDLMAAMMVVQSVIKASVSPLLVARGYGVPGAVAGHAVSYLVVSLLSVALIAMALRGRQPPAVDDSDESSLWGMLRFGFPLFIGNFVGAASLRYQGLLQAWFATDLAIGNLNIAVKFKSLVGLFTTPITWTLYPAFSKFDYEGQREELASMFVNSIRYATVLVVPATALIMIMSRPLVFTLFGSGYAQAPFYLALALMEFLAVGLGSLSAVGFLNSQGDTRTTLNVNGVTVAATAVLCTALTWRWGVPGLLLGAFVSKMAGFGYCLHRVSSRYGMRVDVSHTGRTALFSAVSALATYALMEWAAIPNSFVHLAVGSVVFLAGCMLLAPLTGAVDARDLGVIRRILRRETVFYPLVAPFLDLEERIVRLVTARSIGD